MEFKNLYISPVRFRNRSLRLSGKKNGVFFSRRPILKLHRTPCGEVRFEIDSPTLGVNFTAGIITTPPGIVVNATMPHPDA